MSGAPRLYSIWHLNLMYSSIEESQRLDVIKKCFWPLLHLAERGYKIGIEAPGLTLEIANELDPPWVRRFAELLQAGSVELVGSGYSQLIAPLVPAIINQANLREGFAVYERLLGVRPDIWMFNEQAFSNGLVSLYEQEGIKTVVFDWSSAYGLHPEWPSSWAFAPATLGHSGPSSVRVLWSDSLAFQKFQRHIHRESLPQEYPQFLDELKSTMARVPHSVFCIYGNDAEIFDFRPGRFATEPEMASHSEWPEIERAFESMCQRGFELVLPSEAALAPIGGRDLQVSNLVEPGSVKKQPKYNLTRWGLTGRGSPFLNQACWDLLDRTPRPLTSESGRHLCELWSSDYRTHLTQKRWLNLQNRLTQEKVSSPPIAQDESEAMLADDLIKIETRFLSASLNPLRGLSLESLSPLGGEPILGRRPHGSFSRMDLSADWYTGNAVLQLPGKPQVTDLKRVKVSSYETKGAIGRKSQVGFLGGSIVKTYEFSKTAARWTLSYKLNLPELPIGSLRLGFLTLMAKQSEPKSLRLQSHCGGLEPDIFDWPDVDFDHGAGASSVVSARQAIGMTEGVLSLEMPDGTLEIVLEESSLRPLAMVESQKAKEGRLIRLYFSISEHDETRKSTWTLSDAYLRFGFMWHPRAAGVS